MKTFSRLSFIVTITFTSLAARAQHADVLPRVQAGRIVTDAHFDDGSGDVPNIRVFGYDFQEDSLDPFFASDPGFNAPAGSGLPAASQLRFNLLGGATFGLPANLTYWNGAGPVSFSAVPSAETLRLSLGSQNRTAGSSNTDIAGFALGTVSASGSLHVHLSSFLNGSDGNNDPTDGFAPANGIYLIALELASSDNTIQSSAPLFVVYNNGFSETAHDEAIDFVQASFVPEPVELALLVVAIGVVRHRGHCR